MTTETSCDIRATWFWNG